MASSNSLSTRLGELRSRNPTSPQAEPVYSGYNTPTRYSGSFMPSHSQAPSNEVHASMQRRFTADSNSILALSPIGPQAAQPMEAVDMSASTLYKMQALEKKRLELEKTREQRRRFDAELEKFNRQQAQEERELRQMASDLQGLNLSSGHQSEPTTPPEYRDQGFASTYSRRNRYSSSSLMSPPPGLSTRQSRSGSQLTSPPPESQQLQVNGLEPDKLPSKSVPGSRRGSSDRFSAYLPDTGPIGQRSTASNRYSMPVAPTVKPKRESVPEFSSMSGMGPINTASFLFGDDEEKQGRSKESATSPGVKTYLQMNTTDDKFPILIRNNHQPGVLSASSAALDLALSQSPGPEAQSNGWPSFARHRHSQNSLPQNAFDSQKSRQQSVGSPTGSSQQSFDSVLESPTINRASNRHSMEASLASLAQSSMFGQAQTNGNGNANGIARPNLANLQSSYSMNDVPTLKNATGVTPTSAVSPPNTHAQQHFHNHNASLGRIPPNAMNNRLSRELSSGENRREEVGNGYKPASAELQASAAPFGPTTAISSPADAPSSLMSSPALQQYQTPAFYGGYGVQLLNMGMSPMQMGAPMTFNNPMSMYQAQPNAYAAYPGYGQAGQFRDSQARVMQQRRMQNAEEIARFTNAKIENYRGEIYNLCKDQHGCRYLQKQLESRNPEAVHLIFLETQDHVVELMTDPFGNYLCQKLLEHSNDDQRTTLVNNSAPDMVTIALNQHGTRALQKMIEFISTPEQIQTVIRALKDKVVELIQDLNGNHVIQKCLNRLSPEDAQFIFDAVGTNCVVVGTHRHGCCVLQRCIDHASGQQKADLIAQITQNAFALVQDPFGNYVLQYIVDLNEPAFTDPLCYSFQKSIPALSKQKFSSNVIEKCLRHAQPAVCTMMTNEMLNANELEKMLRDSYANYVVQTALDFADRETKERLTDAIRPILPSIRGTPYGRRIQTKIVGQGEATGLQSPGSDVAPPVDAGPVKRQSSASGPGQFSSHPGSPSTNVFSPQNGYAREGMMAQPPPPPPSQYPSAIGASPPGVQNLSNGSSSNNINNFGAAAANAQNPVQQQQQQQQPGQQYGPIPPTNGFNYF